ncbi:flavin reductase family protein [Enterovirga aerilata]|uniref:Flavin reductase family protein n=1 Tax=Enterovirga aerilata TaxID=2730920 RepID=A0A849I3J5_9HYPH|nr:flavin reductase family protein [Enterovirga sp. DB1703]NNM70959.1 flavin reductase family protein [Enterovirga sp. DB1703]
MTMLSLPLDREATDPRLLRQALGRFATGVTVITTKTPDGKYEGLTANSFSAVSLDPPLVLWSLRLAAPSLPGFKAAGHFVVNVLSTAQSLTSRHFATPRHDKFEGVRFSAGIAGCPMLDESLAIFECRTESTIEGGDHMIFIGRVVQAHYREGEPLIFAAGKYGTHAPLDGD